MQVDQGKIEDALRTFFVEEILDGDRVLDLDAELDEVGVDSFSWMEVLLFVERQWNFSLPAEQLTAQNTRSVRTMAACVYNAMQHQEQG